MRTRVLLCGALALSGLLLIEARTHAAVSQTINYQAVLTSNGSPVTAPVSVVFTIYDAVSSGTPVWTETRSLTPDGQGRVNVRLGELNAVNEDVFSGADRWLGVQVGTDLEMAPRMPLASSSYAFRTATIDGAKGGEVSGDLVLRSTAAKDGMAAEARIIFVGDLGDSLIFGPADAVLFKATGPADEERMSAVVDPVAGAMLSIRQDGTEAAEHVAGQSSYFSSGASKDPAALSERVRVSDEGVACFGATVDDVTVRVDAASGRINAYRATFGVNNTVSVAAGKDANGMPLSPDPGLVAGDNNTLTGSSASAIGNGNTVGGSNAIALGYNNVVNGHNSLVGGFDNFLEGNQATVFGDSNYVGFGQAAIVCFGEADSIGASAWASILGGRHNVIDSCPTGVIAGGSSHLILSSFGSTIGGGNDNRIRGGNYSTINGGVGNRIDRDDNGSVPFVDATIGGGRGNMAGDDWATVGGGYLNVAGGGQSTVAGGSTNDASGHQASIGGGILNTAGPGNGTAVAGGESNTASGNWATVPGGYGNVASGVKSFAAGYEAQAGHDGAFVWADATGGGVYSSTGSNQFLIKATGNVGINTNTPKSTLHVEGAISTKVVSASGNYSMGAESVVLANAPLAGLTVTIPSASSCSGRQVTVKKTDNLGTVTVATSGGTIDGAASFTLAVQYDFVSVVSNGADWFVVSR